MWIWIMIGSGIVILGAGLSLLHAAKRAEKLYKEPTCQGKKPYA